jgi:glycosyltransferase involved in cell wall biosynthesis
MAKLEHLTAVRALKTGLIAYGLDRQVGGIGRYTEELTRALGGIGAGPVVLDAGGCTGDAQALVLRRSRLMPALLTLGQAEISWLARRHKLELVHDPTGCMPLLLTRARRVVTLHDVFPYTNPKTSTRLDWLIYHVWLPQAAQYVDAIITVSAASRFDILRFMHVKEDKVMVIPEAANARYRPMDPDDFQPVLGRYGITSPYILYVGSLEKRKNLPRLLEAYARLRQTLPEWNMVIVGARKWKAAPIFDTVQRLNLEPYVCFTGYVEEEDLPALYNGAGLFAFPSLYEGFGLPVLEAMACGTPVITSNISSLPEVSGDAALLVDPTDVEGITAAMQRALSEPGLAAAMRQRGLERASQFTWERTARETLAVYEQVLSRNGQ